MNLLLNKIFRKWLTLFLQRIATRYPDTFASMLDELYLKPLQRKVIIDRYINKYKWESFDYVDERTAKNYHKIFLDKLISIQK